MLQLSHGAVLCGGVPQDAVNGLFLFLRISFLVEIHVVLNLLLQLNLTFLAPVLASHRVMVKDASAGVCSVGVAFQLTVIVNRCARIRPI